MDLQPIMKEPAVHAAMGCVQQSFKLVWWCFQVLSIFLVKYHLPRVSHLSANDGDETGAVLRSPGVNHIAEKKTQENLARRT